jgi:hypothetical protein
LDVLIEGVRLGVLEILILGVTEGVLEIEILGVTEGVLLILIDGVIEGDLVILGVKEGVLLILGVNEGDIEGVTLGVNEGDILGVGEIKTDIKPTKSVGFSLKTTKPLLTGGFGSPGLLEIADCFLVTGINLAKIYVYI